MRLDFSRYCWKLERHSEQRLDLVLHCAPGMAEPLCKGLPATWGFRIHSNSSIRTSSVAGLRVCLLGLEAEDELLHELVDAYVGLASELKRGRTQTEEHLTKLHAISKALLQYTEAGST